MISIILNFNHWSQRDSKKYDLKWFLLENISEKNINEITQIIIDNSNIRFLRRTINSKIKIFLETSNDISASNCNHAYVYYPGIEGKNTSMILNAPWVETNYFTTELYQYSTFENNSWFVFSKDDEDDEYQWFVRNLSDSNWEYNYEIKYYNSAMFTNWELIITQNEEDLTRAIFKHYKKQLKNFLITNWVIIK